jgi:sulfonate transport system permease protein
MDAISKLKTLLLHFRGLAVPLVLALIWEILSRKDLAYASTFVSLGTILEGFMEVLSNGELLVNLGASLSTATTGLLIGGTLGISLGSLMGLSKRADQLIGPLFHSIRQVPLLGWIPLIGLWFGSGSLAKTLVVSLASFYPMVLNTYEGLRNIDGHHIEVGKVLAISRWQLFVHILLPGALPFVFTGLSHALAFSWISTVGSELLFTAGPGLGGLMQTAQMSARMEIVIVCVASIGITGLVMNYLFTLLSRRLLSWRATQ